MKSIALLISLLPFFSYSQITYQQVFVAWDSAKICDNISIIPIFLKEQANYSSIVSLQEALKRKLVTIEEIRGTNQADVHTITIHNNSKQAVFISSGTTISGGKQDRIIAESVILQPNAKNNYIATYCIEKGRWVDKAKPFKDAAMADYELKKIMIIAKKQNAVWRLIENSFKAAGKEALLVQPYLSLQKNTKPIPTVCDSLLSVFFQRHKNETIGIIVLKNGILLGCEAFNSPSYFMVNSTAIVQMFYNAIRINHNQPTAKQQLISYANTLFSSEALQKSFLKYNGAFYEYNKQVIHLIAY